MHCIYKSLFWLDCASQYMPKFTSLRSGGSEYLAGCHMLISGNRLQTFIHTPMDSIKSYLGFSLLQKDTLAYAWGLNQQPFDHWMTLPPEQWLP